MRSRDTAFAVTLSAAVRMRSRACAVAVRMRSRACAVTVTLKSRTRAACRQQVTAQVERGGWVVVGVRHVPLAFGIHKLNFECFAADPSSALQVPWYRGYMTLKSLRLTREGGPACGLAGGGR
jgi:hypothetical protein